MATNITLVITSKGIELDMIEQLKKKNKTIRKLMMIISIQRQELENK